ncbi:MAG: T9SS type B sorting domain-containing protein [Saprospiraceae bacterium]|nr:T9SS type B sorting domain-containing protein [Saprospiraceae bacterium]
MKILTDRTPIFYATIASIWLVPYISSAQMEQDDCINALEVTSIGGWCSDLGSFSNVEAAISDQEMTCQTGANVQVWFTFVAAGSSLFIATSSKDDDQNGLTKFATALYKGSCANLTLIDCQNTMQHGPAVHWIQDIRKGERIYLQVGSEMTQAGNFGICINSFSPLMGDTLDQMDCGLLSVSTSEDVLIEKPQIVELQAYHSPADRNVTYSWFKNDSLLCTNCSSINDLASSTVPYSVRVEDENGCIAEKEIAVVLTTFGRKRFAYVPNAFSPNGDQNNDYLTVFGDATMVNIKFLNIYDRHGRLVFRKEDITPGLAQEGWDGSSDGRQLSTGTFAYLTVVEYIDGASRRFFGNVHLIR